MNTDASIGQRVEVVEPQTKGAARYVGESMPVARGWERQADIVGQPDLLRRTARSNAASYRHWLDELAVAYVAVPDAKLDFASVDEAKLIATRPPLPRARCGSNADWKLYQVIDSAPLARHAQVLSVDGQPAAAAGAAAVRWCRSRSAGRTTSPSSTAPSRCRLGVRAHGCLSQNGAVDAAARAAAGTYVLTSDFDVIPDDQQRGGTCRRARRLSGSGRLGDARVRRAKVADSSSTPSPASARPTPTSAGAR